MNECNDLRVNPRNTAFGTLRLPTPEEPKSLAVPTKYRVGLHEQQRILPMRQKAREQNYETALIGSEDRTFDLSECDDELLAKQGVLHQQLGSRARSVGNETSKHGEGSTGFSNRCSNSI